MASPQVNFNWSLSIFLTVLSHFTPPYVDYAITAICLFINYQVMRQVGVGNMPLWMWIIMGTQVMSLWSGMNTDHDPLDGEMGGVSEPGEWL